jgi:hypothetical protein
MDLDHKQIEDLLPFLQHFVKTAKLPDRESPEPEVVGRPVTSKSISRVASNLPLWKDK